MPAKITVAIVTARRNQDTSYDKWQEIRTDFLNRKINHKYLRGEFGALLASCFGIGYDHHVEYQLLALLAGTKIPDRVIVIDRVQDDITGFKILDFDPSMPIIITRPMISQLETKLAPESTLSYLLSSPRDNSHSFGCSDKNTAIILCETEYLVMLDDCCLPGFGLVQAAYETCERGQVLLVGHGKMLDNGQEIATANWTEKEITLSVEEAKETRRVFGVWAMPLNHALALNGFNVQLDGFRGWDDAELLERMDRYAKYRSIKYELTPSARVYELDHTNPWTDGNVQDWQQFCPDGWQWRAPGPDLAQIRKRLGITVGGDFFGVIEEEEFELVEVEDGEDL